MVGIFALVLLAVALGIYSSPNSYAYLFLTGACDREPVPDACHPRGRMGGGYTRITAH